MPDRPVRLTFPAREPGARRIMAGKLQVGVCLADHLYRWQASLWSVAGRPDRGRAGIVRGSGLASLRDAVRKRVAEEGPWWSG